MLTQERTLLTVNKFARVTRHESISRIWVEGRAQTPDSKPKMNKAKDRTNKQIGAPISRTGQK